MLLQDLKARQADLFFKLTLSPELAHLTNKEMKYLSDETRGPTIPGTASTPIVRTGLSLIISNIDQVLPKLHKHRSVALQPADTACNGAWGSAHGTWR